MRALVGLMAVSFGSNLFAAPASGRIHIWECNDVNRGIDSGYTVGVLQDSAKGTVATISMQSFVGPQALGEYSVSVAKPTVARGNFVYLDKATLGRKFTLTITPAGQGRFRGLDTRGNPHGAKLRCFRTRGL